MPTFDGVFREVYGTADELRREVYGPVPRAPKPPRRFMPGSVPPRSVYEVTSHARLLCDCGHYVYTERVNEGLPRLPERCWFCGAPIPSARKGKVT